HSAGRAAFEQSDSSQNERPHDALAKLGFADQEPAQALCRNEQRFDVAFRLPVDQRRAGGELADVREELTGALLGDRRHMAEAIALADRDYPLEHDEHSRTDLSGLEQFLAVRIFAQRTV